MSEAPRDPPPREHAARKMEVDEDYDNAGEDDKRAVPTGRTSPRAGLINGQTKAEPQN